MRLEQHAASVVAVVELDGDTTVTCLYEAVRRRLWTLPTRQRNAVWFHLMLDLRLHEVAHALDCDLSTGKTHYYRGLRALRREASGDWALTMNAGTPE
jgi:DNA-directed RNA polymerase specialized sigma24 family protein